MCLCLCMIHFNPHFETNFLRITIEMEFLGNADVFECVIFLFCRLDFKLKKEDVQEDDAHQNANTGNNKNRKKRRQRPYSLGNYKWLTTNKIARAHGTMDYESFHILLYYSGSVPYHSVPNVLIFYFRLLQFHHYSFVEFVMRIVHNRKFNLKSCNFFSNCSNRLLLILWILYYSVILSCGLPKWRRINTCQVNTDENEIQ